jgi:hypothetical protein
MTVAEIMEEIGEGIEVVRLSAAILVRDGRIGVERRDPPEESLIALSECEANDNMIRMLAQLKRKRAAVNAKKAVKRRKAAK